MKTDERASGPERARVGMPWSWLVVALIVGSGSTLLLRELVEHSPGDASPPPAVPGSVTAGEAETDGPDEVGLGPGPVTRPRANRIPQHDPTSDLEAEVEALRKELMGYRAAEEAERSSRLESSFGDVSDVLADPELNPEGKKLSKEHRRALREALLELNKRRSIQHLRTGELHNQEAKRRLASGNFIERTGRDDPFAPNGGHRTFMTQFLPDGPPHLSGIVDVYPGEVPEIDAANAERDLLILEGRQELRLMIALF